jgi:hypothetical protein
MIRILLGMALKNGIWLVKAILHTILGFWDLGWVNWIGGYGPVSDPNTHYDYATIDDCFKAVTSVQLCTATIFLTHLS